MIFITPLIPFLISLTKKTWIFSLNRSNAPHRSLPDIPIVEIACDNNSELYATVGDKLQDKPQEKSPSNTKKLANISQHSSMSQADDASSPYARVRSPAHAYDKLKKTEHPYAQVGQHGSAGGVAQVVLENDDDDDDDETTIENPISHRESSSNNDLLGSSDIPASAAISGLVSASQELPYMTPPIVPTTNQQHHHFSGDSQDSSSKFYLFSSITKHSNMKIKFLEGYTSISVREPLANIIAQTNQQNAQRRRREIQDSHYATVSDDSDEMYAAIEDPNNTGDLYTSGSETYAQIQAPMTVSVEINAMAPLPPQQQQSTSQSTQTNRYSRISSSSHPIHPIEEQSTSETLKNLHSRQASSSSCTSSVGNIGSPKPEKRQANSPLPPTPKGQHQSRNSTSSTLEYHEGAKAKDSNNNKMKQSPSKDLEGMYAKVMKKNKLSNVPSENSSPVLKRQSDDDEEETVVEVLKGNEYETIDKKRNRVKEIDAGYETIPADRNNNKQPTTTENSTTTTLPDYAQIGEKKLKAKVSLFQEPEQLDSIDDPKYETLKLNKQQATDSDYDPNYEMVLNKVISSSSSSTLVDDGYSQIGKKLNNNVSDDEESIPGYSTIKKPEPDYSSIGGGVEKLPVNSISDNESNIYSSIPPVTTVVTPITPSTDDSLDYTTNDSAAMTVNNNYESLSNSTTTLEEPNYESMKYFKENPYERLHNDKSPDPDAISPASEEAGGTSSKGAVEDFFKV